MNIGFTVDGDAFVFGKELGPGTLVAFLHPVVAVEASPEDRFAVAVEILLRYDALYICAGVDDADRIVGLSVDRNLVTTDDVEHERLFCRGNDAAALLVSLLLCLI